MTPLPNRRPAWVWTIHHAEPDGSETKLHVTFGVHPETLAIERVTLLPPAEVFIRPRSRAGSFLERSADDDAIFISKLLQNGVPLAELARATHGTIAATVLAAAQEFAAWLPRCLADNRLLQSGERA